MLNVSGRYEMWNLLSYDIKIRWMNEWMNDKKHMKIQNTQVNWSQPGSSQQPFFLKISPLY